MKNKKFIFLYIIISIIIISKINSLDNGLGLTPQMGWNTWNKFGCNINESLIRETIDFFNKSGLIEVGYKYINLDDCWQKERDNITKKIKEDPDAFPSGIKSLADYAHEKGLLLGLYSDAGEKTCAGRPGSLQIIQFFILFVNGEKKKSLNGEKMLEIVGELQEILVIIGILC